MIIINIIEFNQVNDYEVSQESVLVLADYYGLSFEATELLSQGYSPIEVANELDLL